MGTNKCLPGDPESFSRTRRSSTSYVTLLPPSLIPRTHLPVGVPCGTASSWRQGQDTES